MATLHIRDLKDSVKERLRVRAAHNKRSMEAEARAILEDATGKREPEEPPYQVIPRAVAKYGPLDLEFPPRETLTGAQFVSLARAAVETYGPLDVEIPSREPSRREIPDFS
jgi:plasmid stability protein